MGELKFITPLKFIAIVPYVVNKKWNGKHWISLTTLEIMLPDGRIIVIPAGFVTNFGSIPAAVRSFLDRMGLSLRWFILHDFGYSILKGFRNGIYDEFENISQTTWDDILLEGSQIDGEGWLDARAINFGLDIGGWTCFKDSAPVIEKVSEKLLRYIAQSNEYRLIKNN